MSEINVVVRDLQEVYGALTPDVGLADIDGMAYAVERAIRFLQSRLAATPSDRARVDGEVTREDRDFRSKMLKFMIDAIDRPCSDGDMIDDRNDALDRLIAGFRFTVEQRALAAEAREREAIRQREISDRTAQERRELADHNLRLANEIEADLRASEQRVRALVEEVRSAREAGYRAAYRHVLGLARVGVPDKDFERDVGAYMADFMGPRR